MEGLPTSTTGVVAEAAFSVSSPVSGILKPYSQTGLSSARLEVLAASERAREAHPKALVGKEAFLGLEVLL